MSLTTPMKIIIAFILIGLIGAGFYLLDWQAKFNERDNQKKQLEEANQKLAKIKEDIKALPELTKQMEDKERELNALVSSKMSQEDPQLFVANYIAEIERMVVAQQEATQDYDFDIQSITPGAQANAAPAAGEKAPAAGAPGGEAATPEALQGFPTRVFQMQMTARYSTLVDFLYQLGALKLDRLVTINKISLSPNTKGEGGESPVLSVQIPITAYMKTGQ
jgi:Tfp pilus assembly protein PilO